jgi:hypothetical protein
MTDLDPESQHILELASAARTPRAQDKARVSQRLGAAIGVAAGNASAAHAAAVTKGATIKTSGGVALFKWIAASAVLATAVVTYVAMSSQPTPAAAPRVDAHPQAATAPAAAAPEPATVTAAQPVRPAPIPAAVPEPQSAASHTPRRVEHRRPAAASAAAQDEIGLLHRAQAAWRAQDPKTALALLDEHRARYPHSQLQPERDALQALSLCELGKRDEGRRLARSVIARAPSSPLRASLEQSCALK